MKKSSLAAFLAGVIAAASLTSCGETEFHALSEEKQIEYIEKYMMDTYNEKWEASGVLTRTEKFAKKIPAGMFLSTLNNPDYDDTVIMWITSDGRIFENRFMLRMREPAKKYLINKVEGVLPDTKVFAFITVEYPELYGDYRKTGNVEPFLTEPNLNIELEVFSGKDKPFKSDDIQTLASALKEVQFDNVQIWNCDITDINSTELNNSQLKLEGKKVWNMTKSENGKFSCTRADESSSAEPETEE